MIGVAHGGLTNVPQESPYLLDKGERVLSPGQNKDFTDLLAGAKGGGGRQRVEFVYMPDGVTILGKLLWKDSRNGRNRLAVT